MQHTWLQDGAPQSRCRRSSAPHAFGIFTRIYVQTLFSETVLPDSVLHTGGYSLQVRAGCSGARRGYRGSTLVLFEADSGAKPVSINPTLSRTASVSVNQTSCARLVSLSHKHSCIRKLKPYEVNLMSRGCSAAAARVNVRTSAALYPA